MPLLTLLTLPENERSSVQEAIAIVKSRKNYVSDFDVNALALINRRIGPDLLFFTIQKCMANDWLKSERWEALSELVHEFGIERVTWAVKRMNGRDNHSIDTVEGLLRGSIKPYRTAKDQIGKASAELAERPSDMTRERLKYPTKEGIYLRNNVRDWMTKRNHSLHAYQDYFYEAGHEALFGWPLYQLKSEYR